MMPPGLQQFLEGISAWAGLMWVVFIVGTLALVARWLIKAWPTFKLVIAVGEAIVQLPAFMERIRHQVENDHDTNLRDEVTQVLDAINDIAGQMAVLADWQKKHEEKSDAALGRIHDLEKRGRHE